MYEELREGVLDCVRRLCEAGLTRLSAGNVSARGQGGAVAITPSGVLYRGMTREDIVIIDLDGQVLEGRHKPSSEWRVHAYLLQRLPGTGAVVHTHSAYAIAFAALGRPIPPVSLEAVLAGGVVPLAPYACPGTWAVGETAFEALQAHPGATGALLQNHGLVAVGADLDAAFQNAANIETAAQIYHLTLQAGTPVELTPAQIEEIWRVYRGH